MKTKKISLFGAILVGCLLVFILYLPLLSIMKHSTTARTAGTTSPDTKNASDKIIQIDLLRLMSHPSLDDIRQGIYDGLTNRGYKDGENIKIDYQDGRGDQTLLKTVSNQFVADKKDYLVGVTTTSAQALANSAQNSIPLISSTVSDPKDSGLAKDNDEPGVNVTGVADHNPVEKQLKFLKQVLPNAKRLGIIYSSSSQNMAELLGEVRTLAPKYDLTLKEATIIAANELAQVAEQLAEDVDVASAPNDNTITSAMSTLASACNAHKVPVILAVGRMVAEGGLATVGLDQRQFGLDTTSIVADPIEGKKAADYPVVLTNKLETVINSKVATELGIKTPKDIMAKVKDASKE